MTADTHPKIQERRDAVVEHEHRSRRRRVIALLVLVALGLAAFGITRSPLLDVDEVRVIGAVRTAPDTIRELAAVEPGAALVGLDLEAAERRLLELPAVEAVESTRTWAGVVTFEVREREPVATIDSPAGVLVVAADRVVIDVVDDPDPSLPVISGAMFSSSVGTLVPPELEAAVEVADRLPGDIGRVTERIELSVDGLALRLRGGGAAELGDARDLDAKFDAVRAFLGQVDLACLDAIDVQAPLVPVMTREC